MKPPAFWRRRGALAGRLLAPLGALYGAVAGSLMRQTPRATASVPVICIGNLVAGGQGKTPAAIAVARLLARSGWSPAFLTRGYGGSQRGPLVVEDGRHNAGDVGDEPLLLARHQPTLVARDRPAGAECAVGAGANIVVMDDGFQNPSLAKTVSILVVDTAYGIGNGRVIPAGPLRAPLAAQLGLADALLLVGEGEAGFEPGLLPVFRADIVAQDAGDLRGRPVLAYAGIGRPDKFFATLAALGADLVGRRAFADHHAYTAHEAASLLGEAETLGAHLVTTEKDLARMEGLPHLQHLLKASRALPVCLDLEDEARFLAWLLGRLGRPAYYFERSL